MPNIHVPPPSYTTFKALTKKTVASKLRRRVELAKMKKDIDEELDPLNFELFGELRSALPEDVKSVEVDGYMVTATQGSPRSTLSVDKLLAKQFKCPHCSKPQTVPVKVVEALKVLGSQPKPSISVREIGGNGHGGSDAE